LEYLIADALEDSHEVEARTNRVIDWLGASLATHEAWKETPLIDYGSQGMTDLSYSVGAVYFHLLYRLIGCEAFNRSVANYIAKYHAGGSIREFLSVAQAETKLDLTPLNDDWLFTTNWFQRLAATTNVEALDAHYRRIAQQAEPSPPR
jgi:aminopeptidase N